MKNIIMLVLMLTLGVSSIQAQGNLGDSKTEILLFAEKLGGLETEEYIAENDGANTLLISCDEYSVRFTFNDDWIVIYSVWFPWEDIEFNNIVKHLNSRYIKISQDEWHSYFDGGVVIIRMRIVPTESREEGFKYFPYFTYVAEFY